MPRSHEYEQLRKHSTLKEPTVEIDTDTLRALYTGSSRARRHAIAKLTIATVIRTYRKRFGNNR